MSNSIRRRSAATTVVDIVLGDAELVSAVRQLEPQLLGALIRHVGLEDSGDLLSLASGEQLRALADDDLWQAGPDGATEVLDADRFAVWVEVLVDAGPGVAADALAALDEDLLAHALAQQMMVLDLDRLAPMMSAAAGQDAGGFGTADIAEKLLEASLSHELDELFLVSLRYRGWDALIDAIHELDARDHALVRRVLERVCDGSMNRVADDGLHTVLSEAESLAEDARGDRDDRRERRGFVSPADAHAFLGLARDRPREAGDDPVTTSYLRRYEPVPVSDPGGAAARLGALLRERGVAGERRMLPETTGHTSAARDALGRLRDTDPQRHGERLVELVYLANLLAAGRTLDGRPMSQVDALTAALTFADAGIAAEGDDLAPPRSLVRRFARGWSAAHADEPHDEPAVTAARALARRLRAERDT